MPNGVIPDWVDNPPVVGVIYTSPDQKLAVVLTEDNKFVAVPPSGILSLADAIAIRDAVDADADAAAASEAVASAAATAALAYPDGQVVAHLNVLKSIERKCTQLFNFADEDYGFYDATTLAFTKSPIADALTVVRASTATVNHPQGLVAYPVNGLRIAYDSVTGERLGALVERTRTRLNTISAAPVSPENIAVTAVAHTISFTGTGTMTLSGAFSGALVGTGVGQLVSLTFTPTAGVLTLTPSGAVTNMQVEVGTFATSRIIGNEGTQAIRGSDDANKALAVSNANEGTLLCEFMCTGLTSDGLVKPIVTLSNNSNTSGRGFAVQVNGTNNIRIATRNATVQSLLTSTTVISNGIFYRVAARFNLAANTVSFSINGGAIVTGSPASRVDLTGFNTHLFLQGSNAVSGAPASNPTIYKHAKYSPRALTDAELIAWSKP